MEVAESVRVGGRATTKGSKRAIRTAAEKGGAAVKAKVWTAAELAVKSAAARRSGQRPVGRWAGKEWTPAQLALLGTDADKVIARRIGRTRSAVTSKRVKRKVPAFSEQDRSG